ncbi:MAG: hypothetical protein K0S44_1090 [Bacteroidetes bacterium]|jgi:uncharacterized protein YggE|nr:hypothetical protein [Bacteroidota bacterium]
MKHLTKLLVVTAFTITTSVLAQTNTAEPKPYIDVTGMAEQEVIPDEIFISIVIRERYVNKEKITIEMQEEKLKSGLKEIGIDLKNLSLSDANADYVKVKWRSKDVLTKKDYTLKVNSATTVGQVFQQLEKIEISDAYIERVNHSKIDSLKKEVRILAIKAAKTKADYLLAAIGEQTGKPLIVQEKENTYMDSSMLNVRSSRSSSTEYFVDGQKVRGESDIQFQKIKIQSAIYVKFLIK